MNAVEIAPALATPETAVPFSVRLAARRSLERPSASRRERRAYARRSVQELEWLRSARLKHGPGIVLLDLSQGGALLEADAPLRPGAMFTLHIEGAGTDIDVALHVLRCHISQLRGETAIYRGACEFNSPLELPLLVQPAAASKPDAFVGIDVAISHLLNRCASAGPGADAITALEPQEVLRVLESLHSRAVKGGADAYRRGAAELLTGILSALHKGERADAIAAIVERRLGRARAPKDEAHQRLMTTGQLLVDLVQRLEPPAPPAIAPRTVGPTVHPGVEEGVASGAWQKIVVRYREGEILKGFTQDFHPSRGHFSLWPSVTATRSERVIVPMTRLKGVFFVRDFAGNADYIERSQFDAAMAGRRIEVTFVDGEVLRGTTLSYRPDGHGFFVSPADTGANNLRVFVVSLAVRHVRFP